MKIHFILDYCGKEYDTLLDDYVPYATSEHSEAGINSTMLRSYEYALNEKGFVLFQECDYLYRPYIGQRFVKAMEQLGGIVSPYDHLNFYRAKMIHSETCDIELVGDTHFRTTERNTMTWGCHSSIIKEHIDIFTKYGYLDDEVWYELFLAGRKLWVPVPSFATHMVKDYMAPSVDWESLWQAYQ